MKVHLSSKASRTTDSDPANIQDQIRARAYELFEARGRETGRELEDWLRAEEEVKVQKSRALAA